MDIILLQKVANLGTIGDRVKVKSGYARNYLVPTGRATMATADARCGDRGRATASSLSASDSECLPRKRA